VCGVGWAEMHMTMSILYSTADVVGTSAKLGAKDIEKALTEGGWGCGCAGKDE
jgi:hypothetical protein